MNSETEIYEYSMLLDFYGQLLTDNQYKVLDMYINQDLSLSEISETLGMSRQGVHDFVKRGKLQLDEYEKKLGLLRKFTGVKNQLESLQEDFQLVDRTDMESGNIYMLEEMEKKLSRVISEL